MDTYPLLDFLQQKAVAQREELNKQRALANAIRRKPKSQPAYVPPPKRRPPPQRPGDYQTDDTGDGNG